MRSTTGTEYAINFGDLYRESILGIGGGPRCHRSERSNIRFSLLLDGVAVRYEPFASSTCAKQLIEDAGVHKSKPVQKPKPDEPAGK